MKNYFFAIIFFFILLTSKAHPFYVSITTLNYNEQSKMLEITVRVFLEDLERHFEITNGKKLNLGDKNEINNSNEFVKSYIQSHLELSQIEKLNIAYLGNEVENDVFWMYLETNQFDPSKPLKVNNSILVSVFDGQSNMVHFGKKCTVLNKENQFFAFD